MPIIDGEKPGIGLAKIFAVEFVVLAILIILILAL
jgi:hypothetical protein